HLREPPEGRVRRLSPKSGTSYWITGVRRMGRLKKGAIPAYRHHKARGLGVVTIDGWDHYLGPYGTPASKQKDARLIRAWQERQGQGEEEERGEKKTEGLVVSDRPTVNELILGYLKHAKDYYRANHGENKEAGCISDALEVVQRMY